MPVLAQIDGVAEREKEVPERHCERKELIRGPGDNELEVEKRRFEHVDNQQFHEKAGFAVEVLFGRDQVINDVNDPSKRRQKIRRDEVENHGTRAGQLETQNSPNKNQQPKQRENRGPVDHLGHFAVVDLDVEHVLRISRARSNGPSYFVVDIVFVPNNYVQSDEPSVHVEQKRAAEDGPVSVGEQVVGPQFEVEQHENDQNNQKYAHPEKKTMLEDF